MNSSRSNVERLCEWAENRSLQVIRTESSVFNRVNVVSLRVPGENCQWLLKGESNDSIEAAAGYVINKLHRLGVDVPA